MKGFTMVRLISLALTFFGIFALSACGDEVANDLKKQTTVTAKVGDSTGTCLGQNK